MSEPRLSGSGSRWSIDTSLLVQAATATLNYGVAIVVPAWLAGATTWVVTARSLARHLRGPLFARGALGLAALLLLVAWAPIPAIRQLILALAPIGLLALGPGAPGSQTARKHTGVRRGQREKDSLLAERPPA